MGVVLIVEDNLTNRMLAHLIVERAGHDAVEADNAFDGLRLARAQVPDLILMDIRLPGLDGLEATRRLKNSAATRHIPIVAITAHAMPEDEARILGGGCDAYLRKPYHPSQLLDIISEFLTSLARITA